MKITIDKVDGKFVAFCPDRPTVELSGEPQHTMLRALGAFFEKHSVPTTHGVLAASMLDISQEGTEYLVDDKRRPGSPPIGRGRTRMEALGAFLIANQNIYAIDITASVEKTEIARRRRELAKR